MEFHAVILCGEGEKLSPFSAVRPSGMPKGLMSVNNKPLVSHALDWCAKGNFKEVLLVSSTMEETQYQAFIDSYCKENPGFLVKVVGIDAQTTGEIMLEMKDKLNRDFVVLPCDFITDVNAQALIDQHRKRDDGTNLVSAVFYKNQIENIDKALVADHTLHTPLTTNPPVLLDSYTKETVSNDKMLKLRMGMLWRFPNTVVSTKVLRSGIYVCSRRVLDDMSEPVANWAEKSWNQIVTQLARRSWRFGDAKETVTFTLLPTDSTFLRANNLAAYMEANRYVLKNNAKNGAGAPAKGSKGAGAQATVGADSMVGDNTTLGEKSSVKRSVVGNGCTIGKKCRLVGCVIMDNVQIADDVSLDNCIVGNNASVQTRAKLVSCNVEGGFQVAKGAQGKNETMELLSLGGQVGGEESSGEDEDDEDEDDESGSQWSEEEEEDEEEDDGLFDRS